MVKVVYVAHPISGDIDGNIKKILNIVRELNLTYSDIVPFAPYIVDCLALNDNVPLERERGIKNDIALFENGAIHEVWLYGNKISNGMQHEVNLALKLGIRVVSKSSFFHHYKQDDIEKVIYVPHSEEYEAQHNQIIKQLTNKGYHIQLEII